MRRTTIALGLLALALGLLAACSGSEEMAPTTPLSIEEALGASSAEPLQVKGFVVAPDGEPVRLCSALLESYPPQCGGPSLVVEGLELESLAGLSHTTEPDLAQVTWSDREVTLSGKLADGALTVVPAAG